MWSHIGVKAHQKKKTERVQGASTGGNASEVAASTAKESGENTSGSQVAYSDLVTSLKVGSSVQKFL